MELNIEKITGKVNTYSRVSIEQGYCFYDVDAEERQYMNYIATPITDEYELRKKYVVVEGDADVLNEELQKQAEEVADEYRNE